MSARRTARYCATCKSPFNTRPRQTDLFLRLLAIQRNKKGMGAKRCAHACMIESAIALDRDFVGLARANADGSLQRRDEDFAVADLAGPGRLQNRVDDFLGVAVRSHDFDLHLRQKVDGVL